MSIQVLFEPEASVAISRAISSAIAAAWAAAVLVSQAVPDRASAATDCPNQGTLRFGIEPYEAAARLTPAFDAIGKLIGDRLGCAVEMSVTTNYNAEIEAMRNGKLDAGEFGPLGYVLAHQVAKADVVATYATPNHVPSVYYAGIFTWAGSNITSLKGVAGHSFAYSEAASTSGHLFPSYALRKAGIDPDRGVQAIYAGSHTSSFEAIRNHKVDAGEINSVEIDAATQASEYRPSDFVQLWRSQPIPNDAIAVRSDLPPPFKKRLTAVLTSLDFDTLPADVKKVFPAKDASSLVKTSDGAYNVVRELVSTLHIDLQKLN